jgi:hypothetical protein
MQIGFYSSEKLSTAMYSLVRAGTIQERLESALLTAHTLSSKGRAGEDPGHFPDKSTAAEFDDIMEKCSSAPAAAGEGTLHATCATLSDEEAEGYTKRLLELLFKVDRLLSEK